MKLIEGVYLPDDDAHFHPFLAAGPRLNGKGTYQRHKYLAALKFLPEHERGLAVDVGAHIGLWSMQMVVDFRHVWAFEPLQDHRECFRANLKGISNFDLFHFAVGDASRKVRISRPTGLSGHSNVNSAGDEEALMVTLDAMSFPGRINFLKIDVEGYELPVVQGARRTLLEHKPVIVVEQKPNNAELHGFGRHDALNFLLELGARERKHMGGDHILTW